MTLGSPPYRPALPGRNATTTVRGAGAGLPPDPASPGCDHLCTVLLDPVKWKVKPPWTPLRGPAASAYVLRHAVGRACPLAPGGRD